MFLKEVMRKVSFKKYIMLSVYKYIIELWRNAVSLENTRWVRVVQGIAKSYCRFLRLARCSNPKVSESSFSHSLIFGDFVESTNASDKNLSLKNVINMSL